MQVLTPSGYKHPSALANGDEVCAFDLVTGAPIVNEIENIDFVDYAEWCRWWQLEDEVPPFNLVRVNDSFTLFREQNIWRNDGVSYTHARELVVGDKIYDDHDNLIVVTSLEEFEDRNAIWYRFDISGDHSYIADGLTVHNASISWTGTGSWTPSNTANWTGGVVPGSGDIAVFPTGQSGTCTLNFGGTITVQSITSGAFQGTWDNSVNNNNVTMSVAAGWNGTGSATRTIKLGSATYNLTASGGTWNYTAVTGLTLTASSATIAFSNATGAIRQFIGGGQSYGTLTLGANSGVGGIYQITGANTFGALNITAPAFIQFPAAATTTISSAFNISGSPGSIITFVPSNLASTATLSVVSGSVISWAAFYSITVRDGTLVASNSFDLGANVNGTGGSITIRPPALYNNRMDGNLG